jgi:hypothetical protein
VVVKITGGKRWLVALDYPERKGEVTQYPWALLIRPPLGRKRAVNPMVPNLF